MKLVINGRERETPAVATVADLAAWMLLPDFGSAVELNGEVVRKADWRERTLRDGDRLEIVRLVGGG